MGVTDQLHSWALLAEHERELEKEVHSLKAQLRRERERSAALRQMLSQAATREGR
jgi:cell division septum initiation protein DivIVA